jgi:hypothetical protein
MRTVPYSVSATLTSSAVLGKYGVFCALNDTNKDVIPFDMMPPVCITHVIRIDEVGLMTCPLKRLADDKCSDTVRQRGRVVDIV